VYIYFLIKRIKLKNCRTRILLHTKATNGDFLILRCHLLMIYVEIRSLENLAKQLPLGSFVHESETIAILSSCYMLVSVCHFAGRRAHSNLPLCWSRL